MILASMLLAAWTIPGQALPVPDSGNPYPGIHPTPLVLEVPARTTKAQYHIPRPSRLAGQALVEVWEESPWSLPERLRIFRAELAPALDRAYRTGAASTTDAMALAEFMQNWADPRPPAVPSLYYNTLRPIEDPELARDGIRLGFRGRPNLLAGERQH
jgi:hypothetical protein